MLTTTNITSQGSDNGTEVFIVNATDLDLGLNGNIRYSLDGLPGSDNIPFEITGALISVRGRLDYEGQTRYSVSVDSIIFRAPVIYLCVIISSLW